MTTIAGKKRLSRSGGRPSKSLAKKGGPPPIPKHGGGRERASTTDKVRKKILNPSVFSPFVFSRVVAFLAFFCCHFGFVCGRYFVSRSSAS